ncbi:MAG TPA: hypothetical protein VFE17_02655 [Candidatus Baltobacteraceae bacterium]|jgi:hypothetical protein|nr:hypothetical protein [Candidatus Baltobacteraceae bacterium]
MQKPQLGDSTVSINWAELNNAVFAAIYTNPELHQKYMSADSEQAKKICSIIFDHMAADVDRFVERFVTVESPIENA